MYHKGRGRQVFKLIILRRFYAGTKKNSARIYRFPDRGRFTFPGSNIAFACFKHTEGLCMVIRAGHSHTSAKKMFTFLKCKHLSGESMFTPMEGKHTGIEKELSLTECKHPAGQHMLCFCEGRYKPRKKQVVITECRPRLLRSKFTSDDQRMAKVSFIPGAGIGIPVCMGAAGNSEGLIRRVRSSRISYRINIPFT